MSFAYGTVESTAARSAARITYLIEPDGRVKKVYSTVKAASHAEEVLGDLS
jgi:peroxiredoxin